AGGARAAAGVGGGGAAEGSRRVGAGDGAAEPFVAGEAGGEKLRMAGEPILIVDDNPANMKLISFLLANRGYEVRTAAGAAEALALLAQWRPRLILLDLQMPGVDGFELTRRLK